MITDIVHSFKIPDVKKTAFIFLFVVHCLYSAGQQSAIDSVRQAIRDHKTKDTALATLFMEFSVLTYTENYDSSLFMARKAVSFSEEIGWKTGQCMALTMVAGFMADENKYDSAVVLGLQALKLAEEINDSTLLYRSHTLLSENYRLLNSSQSLYHGKKYLDIVTALKYEALVLDAMVKMSLVYEQLNDTVQKKEFTQRALQLAIVQNDEVNTARLKESLANDFFYEKNYPEAAKLYREALQVWEKVKIYPAIAWMQSLLSTSYLMMEKKDSALYFGQAALKTAKDNSLKKELVDAYRVLFDYYYNHDDYKNALESRLLFDSVRNEIFNKTSSQNVERAQMQYEQAKKDAAEQAAQSKKDLKSLHTRNILYAAAGLFLLLAVFLLINNRQKQNAKTKIETAYGALKDAQAQLIQSEKMASLGELTAGIAHEIQNPLNFVNNFSDVNRELIDDLNDEIDRGNTKEAKLIAESLRDNETKINHHGKRAEAIVKGMLQHSRNSAGTREPTDINALCDEYLRLSYHGLRAKDKNFNSELAIDLDPAIGKINIVPQDIGRVLLNLYNNAFYAVRARALAEAAAVKESKDNPWIASYQPQVSLSTKRKNHQVEITVKDNGNGIPEKIVDKIFQPFFTTKPTGEGTGLGLSLSYDIVKAHGGEIRVYSKEGEGTTFEVILKAG